MSNHASGRDGSQERLGEAAICNLFFQQCVLDRLPTGAYICDPRGLITYFNHHASSLWGRCPKLVHAADRFCGAHKMFNAEGVELNREQCTTALALKHNRHFNGDEILFEHPDGSRRTALTYVSPVRDAAGKLLGAINLLVDISERKRAEEALVEADRTKNTFLATLAHELRNPLAPLRNAAEILHLKSPPMPEVQWALAVIDRQMQQMTRLVDDLLDVGRITSNKFALHRERIVLTDVLRAAVEVSQPHIAASALELYFIEPDHPLVVDGDATRLTQVVANLLHNAAKYTERGGKIWLAVAQQEGEVAISVRDTGIGIAPQVLPRIFEMFAQADQSPDWAPGGLGIGLTLAKQVVDAHGGTITARSDGAGMGSEFVVSLPAITDPVFLAPLPAETEDVNTSMPTSALRILVADDDRDITESLVMLLEIMGNEVRTARDGEEVLRVAAQFRPDVMVLDIGMPKLNGYDTARTIRAQPWGEDTTLIAFTGWGQESDRRRALEAGFDHHLIKPVEPQTLMQLLSSLVTPTS